ncbi:hypothetical protein niasHT_009724 [Heterodera trifolii]|uniref:Uncharacterized protein n=1 Tax=Heterodera trifolii TaxID=157864 RepID=A0ABD2MDQ6_9BILA
MFGNLIGEDTPTGVVLYAIDQQQQPQQQQLLKQQQQQQQEQLQQGRSNGPWTLNSEWQGSIKFDEWEVQEEWRRLRQEEQKEDEARHVRALAIISEGAVTLMVLMFNLFDCCCGGEMKHRMKIAVVDCGENDRK